MTPAKLKKLKLSADMYTAEELDGGISSAVRYTMYSPSIDSSLSCQLSDNTINYIKTTETGKISASVPPYTGKCRDLVVVVDENVQGFYLDLGSGVTTYIDDDFTASDMSFVTGTTTAYSVTELTQNTILLGKKTLTEITNQIGNM